jgi:hypothetical protein
MEQVLMRASIGTVLGTVLNEIEMSQRLKP